MSVLNMIDLHYLWKGWQVDSDLIQYSPSDHVLTRSRTDDLSALRCMTSLANWQLAPTPAPLCAI